MSQSRATQIRNAAIALAISVAASVAASVAIVTANTEHEEPLTCDEMTAEIETMPGNRGQHMRALRGICGTRSVMRPDGYQCRDGLLYGPGLGGVNEDGSPATCAPRPGLDRWHPMHGPGWRWGANIKPEDLPLHE